MKEKELRLFIDEVIKIDDDKSIYYIRNGMIRGEHLMKFELLSVLFLELHHITCFKG